MNPDSVFGHTGSYDLLGLVDREELAGWRSGRLRFHAQGQPAFSFQVGCAWHRAPGEPQMGRAESEPAPLPEHHRNSTPATGRE